MGNGVIGDPNCHKNDDIISIDIDYAFINM